MKKFLSISLLFFTTTSCLAAQDYSERFIKSFAACTPHSETSKIEDSNGNVLRITKIIQGVVEHNCVYKQVIVRPTARDITVCTFPKQTSQEMVKIMQEDDGHKYNVNFEKNGQTIPLIGLTKSQIIWTQVLNSDSICKRQILSR